MGTRRGRRCFRAVDSMSDESPKLIAIDEETDHQIVHRRRFGKTNRATYKPFDPRPQIDVLALDFLRVLLCQSCAALGRYAARRHPTHRCKTA